MVFLTLFAAKITDDNTKKAPKLAAMGSDKLESEFVSNAPPKIEDPKIKIATPKLAPEEMPKTKGPAKGFLNRVCINKPQTDKPEPTKIAVIALGTLKLIMIVSQLSLLISPPKRILKMSLKGIGTDPKRMFIKKKTISITDRSKK